MTNKLSAILAVGIGLLMVSFPIYSHHGTAMFDMEHFVSVKGTVADFEWTNPHVYIELELKNDKGNVEKWSAEGASPQMMARAGWKRDLVKKGDQITAVGHPAKDGTKIMYLEKIVFANGQELSAKVL